MKLIQFQVEDVLRSSTHHLQSKQQAVQFMIHAEGDRKVTLSFFWFLINL